MVKATKERPPVELIPCGPVMHRAHPCRSISTIQKSFHIESLFALKYMVDGASQFVSQCGQRLPFAVFVFLPRQVRLSLRVVA